MRIPQGLKHLDWWFSPFEFGGYHAPNDSADPCRMRRFKTENNEIFSSFLNTRIRGNESINKHGHEGLLWYFDFRLTSKDWESLFRFLWSGEVKEKMISVFGEVITLLNSEKCHFWIYEIEKSGILVEVPERAKDAVLCKNVARIMRRLHGGEMSDKEFIGDFMNIPDNPIWDFSCCFWSC